MVPERAASAASEADTASACCVVPLRLRSGTQDRIIDAGKLHPPGVSMDLLARTEGLVAEASGGWSRACPRKGAF